MLLKGSYFCIISFADINISSLLRIEIFCCIARAEKSHVKTCSQEYKLQMFPASEPWGKMNFGVFEEISPPSSIVMNLSSFIISLQARLCILSSSLHSHGYAARTSGIDLNGPAHAVRPHSQWILSLQL